MKELSSFVPRYIAIALTASAFLLNPAAHAACTPPPSGIIAWWPAESNAVDIIGGYNGSVPAGVTYAAGKAGQGFSFPGTANITVSNQPALNPTNQLTIECWVYPQARPPHAWTQDLVAKDGECAGRQYIIETGDNPGGSGAGDFRAALWLVGGSTPIYDSTTVVQTNTWYHVAMTYDGALLKLYVNGALDGQLAATGPLVTGTEPVRLGGGAPNGCPNYFFSGILDEPAIYNRALASNEIAAIYLAGSAGKCTSALVGPVITAQPTNLTVLAGGTATFNVTATGTAPLSYQWSRNNTNILGATNATLSLPNVQLAQNGTAYSVLVSNIVNSVVSSNAILTVSSPPPPSCTPPPSGIAAWWQAESNAVDIIGGNNGSVPAGVTYGPGEVGQAFGFAASASITVADQPVLDPTNQLTVECWVYPHARPANNWSQNLIGKDGDCHGNRQYKLDIANSSAHPGAGDFRAEIGVPAGFVYFDGATAVQTNTWYHVAETYDGTTFKLYVNGNLDGQMAVTGPIIQTSEPLRMGGGPAGCVSQYFLDGMLDEPAIYNRALASNEIAAIYLAGSAGKCTSALVGPVITAQPTNLTVLAGGTATFNVTATGTAPLSYQWSRNNTNILGATNATLSLPNVQLGQNGTAYSVLVSNIVNSVVSSNAILTVSSPPPPSCTPPPSGIVAWWPAENNANDVWGTNNGALQGGLGFASGETGLAFNFINTNQTVRVPASTALDVGAGAGFTLEAWINPADVSRSHPMFEWNDLTYWGVHFNIEPGQPFNNNPGPGELYANIPDSGGFWHQMSSPGGVLATNVFQHVALTYDQASGLAVIYCNGQIVAQQNFGSFTPRTAGRDLYLGQRPAPSGEIAGFAGLMDEPAIYNRALASNEIAAIYLAGSAGKCTPTPVVSAAPVIYNFTPASGVVGTVVTITGTNFSATAANDVVRFGGFRASVLTASSGLLTAVVPIGASRCPLTVTVNGSTAYASLPFLTTFPNPASRVVVWGDNLDGQTNIPPGLTNVVAIAVGAVAEHSLVLKADGTMAAWGYNNQGQATIPAGTTNVIEMAGGFGHNLVLKTDGTVAAWGFNSNWDGTYAGEATIPPGLSHAIAISAGWYHSLALKPDGTVLAWGANVNGQTNVPAGLSNVVAIAGAPTYNLALKVDGTVVTWGTNYQSFGGSNVQLSMNPPPGLSNVVAIAAGLLHCLALKADGTVVTWGDNTYGQLNVPAGLANVVSIAAGSYQNLAAKADGSLVTWGISYPWLLNAPSGTTNVVAVSAGYYHSLALVNNSAFNSAPVVSAPPAIASFSPLSGTNGTAVTIFGTNFSATASSNIVYFGAVKANVSFASPTSLTVTVPTGAIYAPITVTVGGLTAWANAPFMPTFNGGPNSTTALATRLDLPAGNSPGQVVFADVDGDGKPDLLVNSGQNFMSIYRNVSTNGTVTAGSFAPRVDVPMPGNIQNAVLADLDGDGKLDIAVLDRDAGQVHLLRNVATPGIINTNSFVLSANLTTGNDPRGIVVRDLDGDGLPDIAVANWADATVSIYHHSSATGISSNTFPMTGVVAVGPAAQDLRAADLDGDGKPDLITANNNYGTTNSISLLRNTSSVGNISFAPQVALPGLPTAYCLAIGDLDGDGKLDIAVSSFDQGQAVSVYRNTSSPGSLTTSSFAANVDFSAGGWGNGVAIGDLDGDGKPDLAVVTQLPDHLSIFKNMSTPGSFTTGSLAPRVDFPTGWNPNGVAIGDLDGDGRPDIAFAVSYGATLSLYQNQTTPPVNLTTTNPPVITSITPVLGAIGTNITIYGTNFSTVAASDIVYFGAVQANVVSATPTSLVVTTPAGATFGPITVTVGGLTAYSGQLFEPTFNGNGSSITTSSFAPGFNLATPNGPAQTVIADLDGDGKPDLIVVDGYNNTLSIFRNISTNGTLTANSFAARVDLPATGGTYSPLSVTVADVDGDGKLDIIATEFGDNLVSVYRNTSTPGNLTASTFATRVDFATGVQPQGVIVRDLDGDGRPDIVTANTVDGTISILRNTGTPGTLTSGSFASKIDIATGAGCDRVAVGDLNGDGRPDLVAANNNAGTVSVLQNLITSPGSITTASFAAKIDLAVPSGSIGVAIVDIDGDGRPDLTVTAYLPQIFSVIQNLNSGGNLTSGSFGPRIDYPLNGRGHTIAAGDINGDGKPDLVVDTELNSLINIFQNLSTPGTLTNGSLATQVELATGWNAWGVSVGDLDGDGRPDLVFANTYDNNLQIYQNQMPFGAPPAAPAITTQPTNLTVTVNNTAVFNVTATGTQPLIYQWSFNGTNISGATNASLTLTNVLPAEAGNYSVLVSNFVGTVTSSNAALTVYVPPVPPSILSQTPSQIVLLGNPATFSVNVAGSDPLSYFWKRNNALIPGATNSSYTLLSAQLSDSGSKFSCLVTNAFGFAVSTNATLKVIDTVSNDLCSGAVVITSYGYTNAQSTVKASSYGDPVPDCIDGFGNGVWYQFTPAASGLLLVDTFGSDFDTGLAIYTGSCGSFTEVACNDDYDGVSSALTIPATAGTTYYFLIGGYSAHVGNLVFHLNYLTPPAFDVPPTNISVVVSSNATFFTTISGTQPITQQWYFNNIPLADGGRISGSTNPVLNIANINTADGGNYFIVASNFVGVTTSSVAVLTPVILPPVIITPPVSQLVPAGSNVTFSAVVDGTPPYGYQWSRNGSPLVDDGITYSGSTTTSLTISNLTTLYAGTYVLTVTNVSGSASASATLTVMVPPVITVQPVGRSVPPGLPTIFNASASGVPTPAYQWLLNGTNISGATRNSLTNPAVGLNDLGNYQVVASNAVGSVTSSVAQLTFGPVAAWGRNAFNESLPPPGLTNVVAVAGIFGASFAALTDGTMVSWGDHNKTNISAGISNVVAIATTENNLNFNYALCANGTVVSLPTGIATGLSNIVAVADGFGFAIALRAEGTLTNFNGKGVSLPGNLNHVTAIACGYNSALALRSDGTVVIAGTGAVTNVPAGLTNVVAIAAGYTYAMALKADGKLVAWGSGTGTNLPAGMTNIVAIAAGNYSLNSGLAIRANGTVAAWGDSQYGETNPPAALTNLFSIAVSAPAYHGLALINDGSPVIIHPPIGLTTYTGRDVTLHGDATAQPLMSSAGPQLLNYPLSYQWLLNGTNIPGATNTSLVLPNIQLANAGAYQLFVSNSISTAISLPAPVTVISNNSLSILTQIAASPTNLYQAGKFTVGGITVLGSGPLRYQWFFSPTNKNYLPVPAATNDTLTMDPALALHSGNYYIAVSNLVSGVTSAPVNVRVLFATAWGYQAVSNPPVNVTNAIALATGGGNSPYSSGHYLALGSDGKVTAWVSGLAQYGETNVAALSNSIVTAIAAGNQTSLALKSDGTVYAWGFGNFGQTNPPPGLSGVTAIAIGGYHDLALKADGTVVGWGDNLQAPVYGQATNNAAATNVVAIAAGNLHSLALRADGSVVAWGYGPDGSTTIPFGTTNIVAITAGSGFSAALRANGTVVQWGNILNFPVPSGLSNVVAISASGAHCTALKNDGTVVVWGRNTSTQLTITSNNFAPTDLTNVVGLASGGDHDMALFGTRAPFFTVQPWNRSVVTNTSFKITLTGKCAGVQPVSYQWLLNGTNLPGAISDSLILTNQPFPTAGIKLIQPGAYQLVASNAYGVIVSKPAKVSATYPLSDAVDATNLVWTTTGATPWYGQTAITHDGFDAVRSGGIGGSQETILQTTLATNFPGFATFWWKVSSEQFFDTLEFRVNGTVQATISGEVDWQQASIAMPAGTNLLQWRYSKDASFDSGLDAGFVDQFAFVAGPPVITNQPNSVVANLGANVTLSVGAVGVPQLKYQWLKDGTPVGGNSPVLAMNSVSRANGGNYCVTVTNSMGSTTSSTAVVRVLVPQLLGSPQLLPDGSLQLTSADANGGQLQPSDLPNFEAQASADLVNWTTLPDALSLTNGQLQLQDTSRTNFTTRFYRIVEHPAP